MDKQSMQEQPKLQKHQPQSFTVLGEATELTQGYNFDYVVETQTWDKRYNRIDPIPPRPR